MHLLSDPDQTASHPEGPPPPYVVEAPERSCHHCGAGMVPEQDWCLECGTAAPGRLGSRPAWKAASTVMLLTLALTGGAAAAAYAAISDDADTAASKPSMGAGAPIAQAPPAIPGPAAAVPPIPTATTGITGASGLAGPPPAGTTGTTGSIVLPPVDPPAGGAPPAGGTPPASTPPATVPVVTPPPVTPPSTPTVTNPPTTGTTTGQENTPPPEKPDLSPKLIKLEKDAASLFDPDDRRVVMPKDGKPSDVLDGDAQTTFFVSTPEADSSDLSLGGMRVGILIDLGKLRRVRSVQYTTATPGHTVEIYATTKAKTPDGGVEDARFALVATRKDVDQTDKARNTKGDGRETIRVKDGKYRKLVLWFTTPSREGPTVGITQVDVSG